MAERLCGLETEYAFILLDRRQQRLDQSEAVEQLLQQARAVLPHLPDLHAHGMFLTNGARFYIDQGLHPEFSTPECTNPWDVVRYAVAGERMLTQLADEIMAEHSSLAQARFYRCNVDYSDTQATWGCHESYLHRANPALLPQQLIPHLVSRVIYTGAGGFNPFSPGIEFTLSPRVQHLQTAISNESTTRRGIFHTKDESLSSEGYHRLHVLCSESVCSETATWLKIGVTALVVAMIEGGLCPGDAVRLRAPLEAMRSFAADLTGTATVPTLRGKRLTALAIQRHYLAQAEANVNAAYMPPWAAEVCERWRTLLDRLEGMPESLDTMLDWRMKLALMRQQVSRHGFRWEALPHWTQLMVSMNQALAHSEVAGQSIPVEVVCGPASPIADDVQRLVPMMREHKLTWDGVRPFLQLRNALCETDVRFGQLGEGIFTQLDQAGVLEHHLSGIDGIEQAVTDPPAQGRARIRGDCIRRLHLQRQQYVCDWQTVWDVHQGQILDLSDPFVAVEPHWHEAPAKPLDPGEREPSTVRARLRAQFMALRQRIQLGTRTTV